jgi:uncharacterized membrane protein
MPTTTRAPLLTLGVLLVGWWLHLRHFLGTMPERIATHFGSDGRPNGWMARDFLGTFDVIFTALVLGITVGSAYLVRRLPVSLINVPHRDFWFAPERRAESFTRLLRHLLWLSCLMVVFLAGVNQMIFIANLRHGPPVLPGTGTVLLVGSFLTALVAWIVRLYRLFPRPPG